MNEQDLAAAVAKALQAQLPVILAQLIKKQPPAPAFSTPEVQVQRTLSGSSCSSLSRASSITSAASLTSAASYSRKIKRRVHPPSPASDDEVQIIENDIAFTAKQQLGNDKNTVRVPVMRALDAKYIAPIETPLFKRFFKKRRNPDGSRSLKKKRELNEELFKVLIRPVLRRLLGTSGFGTSDLADRYYKASYLIVRKRRNNHMDSWRQHGECCRLIYGGELPRHAGPRLARVKQEPESLPSEFDTNEPVIATKQPAEAVANEPDMVNKQPVPMVADFECVGTKTTCCVCGEVFTKDADDWRTGDLRCPQCVMKQIETDVVPAHHGKIKKRKLAPKKKDGAKQPKKRKRRTQCKCGSTTHLLVTHSKCPLNKKKPSVERNRRGRRDERRRGR